MYTLEVYGLVLSVVVAAAFLIALAVATFKMAKDYARARQAMRRITPSVFAETNGTGRATEGHKWASRRQGLNEN